MGVEGLDDKEGVKGFSGVNNLKDGVPGRFFTLTGDCGIHSCELLLLNIDFFVDATISPNLVGVKHSAIILMELSVVNLQGVAEDTSLLPV